MCQRNKHNDNIKAERSRAHPVLLACEVHVLACGLSTSQFLHQHPQLLQPQEDSHPPSTAVGLTTRSGVLTELCISAMCICAMASRTVPVEMMRPIVPPNLVHVPRYKLVRCCVGCSVYVADLGSVVRLLVVIVQAVYF